MKKLKLQVVIDTPKQQHLTLKQLGDLYITYILNLNEGNITRTAEILGVTRRTLQRKLARGLATSLTS